MENLFLTEIQKHCLKCRLEKFEIPQALKLIPEVWTPDMVYSIFSYCAYYQAKMTIILLQGLVTAAFKLKRKNIQDRYQLLIDRMYS